DGPVSAADVSLTRGWFGDHVAVTAHWAPPETGVVAGLTVGPDDDVPGAGVLPAGWCAPDIEVETVDATGCRTPADEFGNVVVWGEALPGAYWANPGLSERRWLGGGPDGRRWCRTGEHGRWDDRGRLVLERTMAPDAVLLTAASSAALSLPQIGFVPRAS
ncbi:MAG TPA: hypothetical protein VGR90_00395, partial [Acidimicrobiales bacterium]|nr:hypothetical protein [Acidimicrobiales bacterium]